MSAPRHERLMRVDYQGTVATTSRHTQDADFTEYTAPFWREHHAALHGTGVAAGLEVRLNAGATGLVVGPGAAVDGAGRLIVLAEAGRALIDAPGSPVETAVPVELSTAGLADTWAVVTLQAEETHRTIPSGPLGNIFPAGKLEQTPRLGLVPVSRLVRGDSLVVLAACHVDATGMIDRLAPGPDVSGGSFRQAPTSRVGSLELLAPREAGGSVVDTLAAEVRPDGFGLRLAVRSGRLEIQASELQLTARVPALLRARHYHGTVDLDANMPHVIHLHFEDPAHVPEKILLFLRGFRFSRAFYTELGRHTHSATAGPVDLSHAHPHSLQVVGDGAHAHAVRTGNAGGAGKPGDHSYSGSADAGHILAGWRGAWASLLAAASGEQGTYQVTTTGHGHGIGGGIGAALTSHTHSVSVNATGAGLDAGTEVKEYLSRLEVLIGGRNVTGDILAKLSGWASLGDGTAGHWLNTNGTGLVDVTELVPRVPGSPEIRFQVAAGGGRLLYDLICE